MKGFTLATDFFRFTLIPLERAILNLRSSVPITLDGELVWTRGHDYKIDKCARCCAGYFFNCVNEPWHQKSHQTSRTFALPKQKAPGTRGKCEGTSKAAMKAKRAHAEIQAQYEHQDVH
jgi:hypothetical protein